MKKISLLDCTLRDGGYVNDWKFGHDVITGTYKRLENAGVEFIEVGFLDERRSFDLNSSILPGTEYFNMIFDGVQKGKAVPVAMIDYGTCGIEHIEEHGSGFIDGIRVIFKKEKIKEALPFCQKIKEKGYKLFIQAISITAYSDMEMLRYINKINEIKPYAFSIVDTYGLLDDKRLKNYFYLIDNNLDKDIRIGYHAHNNFQLAFSNTVKFIEMNTKRELIADSTVYGMGKSAGNCASELISMYLNQYCGKNYDINQFLEILDTDLLSVYQDHYWGYRYNFYISAMHNCHPNYVKYLLEKKTLTVSSVNEILSEIPEDRKLLYDEKSIEEAYLMYQSTAIDDRESMKKLKEKLSDKQILLVGPGRSIVKAKEKILKYIKGNDCKVISVNFVPDDIPYQYIFISNSKRFGKLEDYLSEHELNEKLIITSNITPYGCKPKYVFNYAALLHKNSGKCDNALLLCLAVMAALNVQKVVLAGFDGYTSGEQDYYQNGYSFAANKKYLLNTNTKIASVLKEMSEVLNVEFLTESVYQDKER